MKKLIYLIAFCCFANIFAQDNAKLFKEATQHYADGNYKEAISEYEQILAHNKTSAAVYYNLANAHYKLDHIAPSIYYYEKALQLSPNDADIKNNLAFAKQMTVDAIEELPETGLSKIINNLISTLTYNGWAWSAVIFAFLCAGLFLWYYFSASSLKKRIFFGTSILLFVLFALSLSFAYIQNDIQQSKKYAIVFEEEVSIKAEPNSASDQAFILHEGTKVKVLDNFSGYIKIELTDGRQGWVKAKAIKKL